MEIYVLELKISLILIKEIWIYTAKFKNQISPMYVSAFIPVWDEFINYGIGEGSNYEDGPGAHVVELLHPHVARDTRLLLYIGNIESEAVELTRIRPSKKKTGSGPQRQENHAPNLDE